MERVLVLGGGGFVGQRVIAALNGSGWAKPVAGGRNAPPRRFGLRWQHCDATDLGEMGALIGEFDSVVNCMAGTPATMIKGARNLFQVAAMGRVRRIVHLSSMAVYADSDGIADETSRLIAGGTETYASAKAAIEGLANDYQAAGGDIVVLRPSCVYGPGSDQWTGRIGRLLRAGRLGDLGSAGEGVCNLIHVDDLTDAIIAALRHDGIGGQRFNISSPDVMSWNIYLAALANAIGVDRLAALGPARLWAECYMLAPAIMLAQRWRHFRQVKSTRLADTISPALLAGMTRGLRLDGSKADRMLAFHRTPFPQGLRAAAIWFRQEESLAGFYDGANHSVAA